MKIVAFLQNQWFENPASARDILSRHPERRECLIRKLLFMGCLTGKRLSAAFGSLTRDIVWEEVSREIGGVSSSAFPPDLDHIRDVIARHKPDRILVFGSVAQKAFADMPDVPLSKIVRFPHPAARSLAAQNDLRRRAADFRLEYRI